MENIINIEQIFKRLPHRYPLLLVDKIIEIVKGESCVAIKNVTFNEPHFMGHFPGKPIMPGVLIVEAMAQAAAILALDSANAEADTVYFMSINEAKFRKPVVPGDCLYMYINKIHSRKNVWKIKAEAKVDGQLVSEAILTAMIASEKK